jgi:hypothetical protein
MHLHINILAGHHQLQPPHPQHLQPVVWAKKAGLLLLAKHRYAALCTKMCMVVCMHLRSVGEEQHLVVMMHTNAG